MNIEDAYAKMQAEKAYYAQQQIPQKYPDADAPSCPPGTCPASTCNQKISVSLAEQAEWEAANHTDQAMKLRQLASFLRANPAFDECIQLIKWK